MRVLLVGSGGREHALAWKLAQSRQLSSLYATPGNPGIAHHATLLRSPQDPAALTELAVRHSIDLVVIGPEQPLVDGLVDRLAERGIRAFGPHKAAARLEGSKRFAKEFMARHGIPTAASEAFTEEQAALDFLSGLSEPPVVKLSGLAAGKGVTVTGSMAEARRAVQAAFARSAGDGVVIEERLSGRELSLLAITDSHTWLPLKLARDYKYLLDGDRGPMTGGMGAVAPASLLSPAEEEQISSRIVDRTLQGLRAEGLGFAGVLFIGLMVTDSGV